MAIMEYLEEKFPDKLKLLPETPEGRAKVRALCYLMKPTLYSYWRSSCSWRVRIALALKGIDYDYEGVNLVKGAQREPEFLKKNPQGLVPAYVSGQTVLTESMAIMEYLEEKFPDKLKLLPETPEDRAKVRALCYLIASNTQPIQNLRVLQFYGKGDTSKYAEWASHWICLGFEALEVELKMCSGKFAFGDEPTLLDALIPPQVYNAKRFKVDMDKYPTIQAVNERLGELEAFKKAHPSRQPDTPEGERA
uniref:maleylacetoacetate isomerase n=1 Tax=Steinernema glaseri TaxID=37863 RepID=A0A1I7Z486_9BILA